MADSCKEYYSRSHFITNLKFKTIIFSYFRNMLFKIPTVITPCSRIVFFKQSVQAEIKK